ncbi:hypothetical protein CR513_03070 [Mucuna pruriens]|uniref:Uncharacterized protein n=1 Tax=Mucuna pruriens TaxID=157652 RepID=A0A371IAZ6_MUCPR|nr:hypothetical protein CR513_03070 [Mucuna pruriens]
MKQKFFFGISHLITHISIGHTLAKSLIFLTWIFLLNLNQPFCR